MNTSSNERGIGTSPSLNPQSSKGKPMAKNDPSSVNPVGHTPPFTGDLAQIWHCGTVVLEEGKAGNLLSKKLHTHAAQGYGEASFAFLPDAPVPVGSVSPVPDTLEGCCEQLEAMLQGPPVMAGDALAANANYLAWMNLFLQFLNLVREQLSK